MTFFLGFYASFLLARWWQQVSAVPKLDKLCTALHAHMQLTFLERDDEYIVKKEREFKNRVVRYCLLAMTLCLSDLSEQVRKTLSSKADLVAKGLITNEEYDQLIKINSNRKKTIDGLGSKWFIPLNWAAMFLRDKGWDENEHLLKEHKGLVKEIAGIQKGLLRLSDFKQYRMPHIMKQAITIVIVVYFVCGLIASQGTVACGEFADEGSGVSFGVAIIMNFPFFQVLKYLLILGWFLVANEVSNPFGFDR